MSGHEAHEVHGADIDVEVSQEAEEEGEIMATCSMLFTGIVACCENVTCSAYVAHCSNVPRTHWHRSHISRLLTRRRRIDQMQGSSTTLTLCLALQQGQGPYLWSCWIGPPFQLSRPGCMHKTAQPTRLRQRSNGKTAQPNRHRQSGKAEKAEIIETTVDAPFHAPLLPN